MVEYRLVAPACTLAELRTMTPVIGKAPSSPQTMLPTPWARNSLSYLARGPLCIWSTAVADSSVSALATTAISRPSCSTSFQGAL